MIKLTSKDRDSLIKERMPELDTQAGRCYATAGDSKWNFYYEATNRIAENVENIGL